MVGHQNQHPVEQDRIAERADREAMLEMPETEAAAALVALQRQLALFQRVAIALAEEGQHQLAIGAEPLPVDVEGDGVGRELPPFDDREPPGVVGAADAHMVGDDVEDQTETVLFQRVREAQEALLATQFRIDPGVVDDVVAMGRARPRCLHGRGIDMADAEPCEIGQDRDRIVEGEAGMELQAVGRARRRRGERVGVAGFAVRVARQGALLIRVHERATKNAPVQGRRRISAPISMPGLAQRTLDEPGPSTTTSPSPKCATKRSLPRSKSTRCRACQAWGVGRSHRETVSWSAAAPARDADRAGPSSPPEFRHGAIARSPSSPAASGRRSAGRSGRAPPPPRSRRSRRIPDAARPAPHATAQDRRNRRNTGRASKPATPRP